MVSAIYKFGITYILPNKSWIMWCFRSAELVVYSAYAQCMQRHAAMAIRRPAARAIIHGARWYVGAVSFDVSGCAPLPPLPRGSGKAGRLSSRSPCATTHSLLRLPAKHRPVQRKFNARSVCSTCLACVQRVFATARDWQNVLDRACLSVRFSRLSKRARRYPIHELAEARRKPARYFKHHPGTCI